MLGSEFHEAAILECAEDERTVFLTLSDRLRNI